MIQDLQSVRGISEQALAAVIRWKLVEVLGLQYIPMGP